uniref:C-type lectin domain-containing protein n=1 Tax=Gadus morhua TaxID=8049 RepID=A0A8C5C8Z0_GADMO
MKEGIKEGLFCAIRRDDVVQVVALILVFLTPNDSSRGVPWTGGHTQGGGGSIEGGGRMITLNKHGEHSSSRAPRPSPCGPSYGELRSEPSESRENRHEEAHAPVRPRRDVLPAGRRGPAGVPVYPRRAATRGPRPHGPVALAPSLSVPAGHRVSVCVVFGAAGLPHRGGHTPSSCCLLHHGGPCCHDDDNDSGPCCHDDDNDSGPCCHDDDDSGPCCLDDNNDSRHCCHDDDNDSGPCCHDDGNDGGPCCHDDDDDSGPCCLDDNNDGMYSQLVDEDLPASQFIHDVQRRGAPVRMAPWLWPPRCQYRRATVFLSVLCLVLLVCLIAVATRPPPAVSCTTAAPVVTTTTTTAAPVVTTTTTTAAPVATTTTTAAPVVWTTTTTADTVVTTTTTTAAPVATTTATTAAPVAMTTTTTAAPVVWTTTTTAATVVRTTTTTAAPVVRTTPTTAAPVATTTAAAAACPAGWLSFQGSCYRVSRQTANWRGSQRLCQRDGGQLAVILSAQQQGFLWDLLPRGYWNAFWFGLSDQHTEDVWTWVDGTPLVGGFWEEGEPNNHNNEDCGYIVKTLNLERVAVRSWYDAPCYMSLPFICQKVL